MKKFLIALAICFLVAGSAQAIEPLNLDLSKLPDLNQAVLYSCDGNNVRHGMSFTFAALWEERLNIDFLYITKSEFGALASVKLVDMGKIVQFPILKYISFEPFVYIAFDNIGSNDSAETDYGFGAKIMSVKF